MRIGVYDEHWETAGGGEKLAASYAGALRSFGSVDLVGPRDVDLTSLSERLDVPLSGVNFKSVAGTWESVEDASGDYDLFVNCSFFSKVKSRAERSIYVVHFPDRPPTAGAAGLRLLEHPALFSSRCEVEVVGGFHPREAERGRTYRWTTGSGHLRVRNIGTDPAPFSIVIDRSHCPEDTSSEVTIRVGGEVHVRAVDKTATLFFQTDPSSTTDVQIRSDTFVVPDDPRVFGVQLLDVGEDLSRMQRLREAASHQNHLNQVYGFLDSYDLISANSAFTAQAVTNYWRRSSVVIHPAVRPRPEISKDRLIVSLGRFFSGGHSKKQLQLVEAFRRLRGTGAAKGWELHLIGGSSPEDPYADVVRDAAAGLPVEVITDAPGQVVSQSLAKASIYWHGAGLDENLVEHAVRFEHFGIAVVEAMSSGCVPVVYGLGGPAEIVEDGSSGLHFFDVNELVAQTVLLLGDEALRERLRGATRRRAVEFSVERFEAKVLQAVEGLMTTDPVIQRTTTHGP